MSDTGFDGQGITAGTGLILSLPAPLRPASLFTHSLDLLVEKSDTMPGPPRVHIVTKNGPVIRGRHCLSPDCCGPVELNAQFDRLEREIKELRKKVPSNLSK